MQAVPYIAGLLDIGKVTHMGWTKGPVLSCDIILPFAKSCNFPKLVRDLSCEGNAVR